MMKNKQQYSVIWERDSVLHSDYVTILLSTFFSAGDEFLFALLLFLNNITLQPTRSVAAT